MYYMLCILYIIWGRRVRVDRELGYIDLLCSALFFLLDACFLPFLSSFFLLLPSWLILAPSWTILAPSWPPNPPPKLLRKSMKKGTNERRRKPSMWSILWRKHNYILEGSFWPRVQLFKSTNIAVQLFYSFQMKLLIKKRGPQSKKVNKRQTHPRTVEPFWGVIVE